MRKLIILAIVPLLLSGCYSSMVVKVDIIDKLAVEQSYEYRQQQLSTLLKKAALAQSDEFHGNKKSAVLKLIKAKLTQYSKIDNTTLDNILNTLSQKYDSKITPVKGAAVELEQAIMNEQKTDITGLEPAIKTRIEKTEVFNSAIYSLNDFIVEIETDIKEATGDPDAAIAEKTYSEIKTGIEKINEKLNTAYGLSITDDNMASFVVKAPEHFWKKYKANINTATGINNINAANDSLKRSLVKSTINKTVIRTYYGNSDIAIKMDAPGYFVVKGVKLDASQAIISTFKVLGQGIKYLAYAYGIPVGGSSGGENETIDEYYGLKSAKRKFNSLKEQYRTTTNSLLQKIIAQKNNLHLSPGSANDDKRKQAISDLRDAYEVYKSSLPIRE